MSFEYLSGVTSLLGQVARRHATGYLQLGGSPGSLQFAEGALTGFEPAGGEPQGGEADPASTSGLVSSVTGVIVAASGGGKPARFLLPPDGDRSAQAEALPLDAFALTVAVSRQISDERALRRALTGGGRMTLGPSDPSIEPPFDWSEIQSRLLSLADGSRTLTQILAESPVDDLETLQHLFALKAVGALSAVSLKNAETAMAGPDSLSDLDRFLAKTEGMAGGTRSSEPGSQGTATTQQEPASQIRRFSTEEQEERDALLTQKNELEGQDHFTVLGVDRRASDREIRKAYYELARRYHPDRLRKPHLEDIHGEIEKMFAGITQAYNILSDASSREEYNRSLFGRAAGSSRGVMDDAGIARDAYLRGRKMLDGKKVFEAISLFETAVMKDPSRSEYFYYLGLSQAQNPRWKKKAEENLTKAIEMNPGDVRSLLALARLYHRGGLERRAREVYGEVLKWDPNNEEALAVAQQQQESAGGAGLLRSIFKKS